MSVDTFEMALQRIAELRDPPMIHLCGLGEPLLHPELLRLARCTGEKGLLYGLTTNGYLLTKEKTQALLDAGLGEIHFSISHLHDDYETMYGLKFARVDRNVRDLVEINRTHPTPAQVIINTVVCGANRKQLGKYKRYWKKAGISTIRPLEENNRGGACELDFHFLKNSRYLTEAREILAEKGIPPICPAPFRFVFIGWDGSYFICCNDYRKVRPLGTVFEHSIAEIDELKSNLLLDGQSIEVCKLCTADPINRVREVLLRMENGEARRRHLRDLLKHLRSSLLGIPEHLQRSQ